MSSRPSHVPPEDWNSPVVRADAVVATWGLLAVGNVVAVGVAAAVLLIGDIERAADIPAARATMVVILVIGLAGSTLAVSMTRATVRLRRAVDEVGWAQWSGPPPLPLATTFVLLMIGLAVIAILLWDAIAVLPPVGAEMMTLPLALRTEHLARQAADRR